jgi:hypothetical protein
MDLESAAQKWYRQQNWRRSKIAGVALKHMFTHSPSRARKWNRTAKRNALFSRLKLRLFLVVF